MSSESDPEDLDLMDCGRDSHNPSLKDASSLSQLVDSVVAEVHQSMLNEAISQDEDIELIEKIINAESSSTPEKLSGTVPKIIIDDVVRTNEEEELSDFWDQVINYSIQYKVVLT